MQIAYSDKGLNKGRSSYDSNKTLYRDIGNMHIIDIFDSMQIDTIRQPSV